MILKLKSLNNKLLILYVQFLKVIFRKLNINFKLLFIKKIHKVTLLTSPHIYKKFFEQFQLDIFKVSIFVKDILNLKLLNYLIINKSNLIKLKIISSKKIV